VSTFLHQHYQRFTDIQSKSIQPIYDGENALLVSQTASGKTEAAVIPLAARITENRGNSVCVYIAPTRALLNDLYRRLEVPLHQLGIELAIRHGDRPLTSQDQELSFLLTTPESLDILLCHNYAFLKKVRYVVCDEIHQLLGTPRGLHLLFLLERLNLNKQTRIEQLQRIALSATLGNPSRVSEWFSSGGKEAKVFSTGEQRPIYAKFHWLKMQNDLKDVIRGSRAKKILIFVNSRRMCEDLFLELHNFAPYRVFIHYSTLDKEQREYVESQFKTSEYAICIATSTLELGIDIGSIEVVILFEPPQSAKNLLQRVGRGSRRSGQTWAILTPKNELDLLEFVALITLGQEGIVEDVPPGQFFSTVVQQLFSYISSKRNYRIHQDEVSELCRSFTWIQHDDIASILSELSKQRYLRYEPEWSSYQMGPNLEVLFNDNAIYSNISDSKSGWQIFHEGRRLAILPLSSGKIRIGTVILYAGRFWKVTAVGDNSATVSSTSPVSSPVRPMYGGTGGSYMSSLVTQKMKTILFKKESQLDGLDSVSKDSLTEMIARIPSSVILSDVLQFRSLSETGNKYFYYTFAGGIENAIIQTIFSIHGYECQLMKNAEGLALQSIEPLDFSLIPKEESTIIDTISNHWHRFQSRVVVGPFFNLLPIELKKKEILAQVFYGATLSRVTALSNVNVVQTFVQPF
jgi:ATP-dependent Lhr-like helicase